MIQKSVFAFVVAASLVLVGSTNAHAASLAGRTYSRTFTGTPLGSSQPVEYTQSIRFVDDITVTDNGSTFFGNPPESGTYTVRGARVTLTLRSITGNTYRQVYILSADGSTITGSAGAVLTLEPAAVSLAGKTFSRTFTGTPLGSSVPVEYTQVIQFVDATRVTDNGSTFFGNPPESGTYVVDGNTVTLTLRSITGNSYEQVYTLSADGLSITGEAGAVLTLEN